jgi:hypothetical protein
MNREDAGHRCTLLGMRDQLTPMARPNPNPLQRAGQRGAIAAAFALLSTLLCASGVNAQECHSKADCDPGFICDLPPSAGSSSDGCKSGADCPEADPAPSEVPVGQCEQNGIACTSSIDCPEPATCEDSQCVYRVNPCKADSECETNYQCTVIGSKGTCSSGAGSGGGSAGSSGGSPDPGGGTNADSSKPLPADNDPGSAAGDPGSATGTDAPPAPDVTCEEVEVKACFPKPLACDDDSVCPDGWQCTALPPGGPDAWEGIERGCLPPGVIAGIDEVIPVVGVEGAKGSDESDTGGSDEGTKVPVVTEDRAQPSLGTQGGSEGTSGCALSEAPRGTRATPWAVLGTALIVGGLRRRRR